MSTFFSGSQYGNGGYNPGIPNPGQFNYQPFMMPPLESMSGSGGSSQGLDPLAKYFGNNASSGLDSFSGTDSLGLGSHSSESGHGGESSSSSSSHAPMSDTTLLARFQGLSKKLDTLVKPEADDMVSTTDMQAALDDKSEKFSKEDKQVIQGMMDNTGGMRGKLDHLDGNDDGLIKIDSINKMVVNPDAKQQTPENKMSNTEAANTLGSYIKSAIHLDKAGHIADKYVDKHGKLVAPQRGAWTIDRDNLQKLSQDEQVPEKVRTAAKKFLQNKELLDFVDTANKGGKPDGKYSLHDFEHATKKSEFDSIGQSDTDPSAKKTDYSAGSISPYGGILPPPVTPPVEEEKSSSDKKTEGGSGGGH